MKANNLDQYAAIIGLDWALSIHKRFHDQQIAIRLELKNGPIVYALLKYAWFDLFPIVPATLAKHREAFTHSKR